jgi:hypothetical protein
LAKIAQSRSDANPIAEFASSFGRTDLPDALVYEFEYALRFELGGDFDTKDDRIPRFLRALDRARAVIGALFEPTKNVTAMIDFYGFKDLTRHSWTMVKDLKTAGFETRKLRYLGALEQERDEGFPDDETIFRHWYVCDRLSADDLNKLAWCSIAAEMNIRPRARGGIYLADMERRTMLHIYDDRGMDAVAMDRENLRPLYQRFDDWLLDCDREKIDATFG